MNISTLLTDKVDWYDLSLDFQHAALDVWLHQGKAAVLLFCHGA